MLGPAKKSSFALAFYSLGRKRRQALATLYAFCRFIDDLVDEQTDPLRARADLELWETHVRSLHLSSKADPPLKAALRDMVEDYQVAVSDLEWIIWGVSQDLEVTQYADYPQLQDYCDGVASAVGLCILPILGISREQGYHYALATGRALQLTNIMRDVASDWARGRCYLPLTELQRFNYPLEQLQAHRYNEHFRQLMQFQAERVDQFHQQAQGYAQHLGQRQLRAAEVMRQSYAMLLHNIRQSQYQVFQRRISLSRRQKWRLALFALWGMGG